MKKALLFIGIVLAGCSTPGIKCDEVIFGTSTWQSVDGLLLQLDTETQIGTFTRPWGVFVQPYYISEKCDTFKTQGITWRIKRVTPDTIFVNNHYLKRMY